jgi:uncharacterized protein YjdB
MISLLFACSSPTLTLDGPAEVHVQKLGVVDGPKASLSSGEAPTGLVWTSDTLSVAGVEGDQITAVGPGKATITGAWQSQTVEWALFVEPPITLVILDPPATVPVGGTVNLKVTGRISDGAVPVAGVAWTSSDEALATVDTSGAVTGKAPGTVYISATNGQSQAMVELEVAAP